MKKILLGTSAIAMVAASASAFAADPISLGIVGDTKFGLLLADTDNDKQRSSNFVHSASIDFKGSTTLDNGIAVAVKVDDDFKGADISFSGGFGTLALGDTDSASQRSDVNAPSVAIGGGVDGADFKVDGLTKTVDGVGGDGPKAVYLNTVSGLTVALSYQAGGESEADGTTTKAALENSALLNHGDSEVADVYSFGAKYAGDFGGSSVTIGGGYEKADLATTPDTLAVGTGNITESTVMHFGASVGVDAVTIGAGYSKVEHDFSELTAKENIEVVDSSTNWNIGASYAVDAISFSIAYGYGEDEEGRGATGHGNEKTYSTFEGAAAYDLGGGVSVSAAIASVDVEDKLGATADHTDKDTWYTTFMTKIAF